MSRLHAIAAVTAAAASLAAAPAALAHTDTVGTPGGTATTNACVAQIQCTYLNYAHGKPTDVVRHTGVLQHWTVDAASAGGTVRLRVLRPSHGKLTFIRSSAQRTITGDANTFGTHLRVRKGDVLALTNDTSGLYMTGAPSGVCVRYFNYDVAQTDGSTGTTDRTVPMTRLLLSGAVVR